MKFLVALACLVAVAYAVDDVQVLRNELNVLPESYVYGYELGNGVSAQESGSLKNSEAISAQGSYKFTAPDGQTFETQYIADENGYQPTGAHIPEIPILIQRSLAYLASAKPYVEKN
ncbi:larval cuticle protein 65Ag1-like [Eupeodes corollae]|uniref:larval cuticle protein 65Ag1-like n=1 Tax=Eupeodes corollae TaxID=290404 RepID=UPI002490F140|nr:larval cuticle protein 65Ag1-like [Eupeodes corollae]